MMTTVKEMGKGYKDYWTCARCRIISESTCYATDRSGKNRDCRHAEQVYAGEERGELRAYCGNNDSKRKCAIQTGWRIVALENAIGAEVRNEF